MSTIHLGANLGDFAALIRERWEDGGSFRLTDDNGFNTVPREDGTKHADKDDVKNWGYTEVVIHYGRAELPKTMTIPIR